MEIQVLKYLVMGLVYLEIRLTKYLLYLNLNDVHFTISSTFANILNIQKKKRNPTLVDVSREAQWPSPQSSWWLGKDEMRARVVLSPKERV